MQLVWCVTTGRNLGEHFGVQEEWRPLLVFFGALLACDDCILLHVRFTDLGGILHGQQVTVALYELAAADGGRAGCV